MPTRTHFVFLMHPKEFKQEKAGTGRLTQLCLPNSILHMGMDFADDADMQALIEDPKNFPVLLYPGKEALNLSEAQVEVKVRVNGESGRTETEESVKGASARVLTEEGQRIDPNALVSASAQACAPGTARSTVEPFTFAKLLAELAHRRLVVFLLDATWSGARKMLRLSPNLQRLPRIMFTPEAPSRFVIKQQPQEGCLSTLEATHELLLVLARRGLDEYVLPEQLLGIFKKMQDYQIACASDPARAGYRRRPYSAPAERIRPRGRSGRRRRRYLKPPETSEKAE